MLTAPFFHGFMIKELVWILRGNPRKKNKKLQHGVSLKIQGTRKRKDSERAALSSCTRPIHMPSTLRGTLSGGA